MSRCFLGLGGNVGDVAATFAAALADLASLEDGPRIVRTSRLYRTAPVGAAAGGEFLNAAAEIETGLTPLELLERIQSIEAAYGRTRDLRWGPRPLDVDLLLYDDQVIEEPRLSIPHPALWYRRFVLDPLAEIAGDVPHPVLQATVGELRSRLLIQPFRLQLVGGSQTLLDDLLERLRERFPLVEFEAVGADAHPSDTAAAIIACLDSPRDAEATTADGGAAPDAARLRIPADKDGGLAFLSAVVASATDEPVVVAGPLVESP